MLAALREARAPLGVLPEVWQVFCLAAHLAMESGRRRLHYRTWELREPRGEVLAAVVTALAVGEFWDFLGAASAASLPET